MARAPKRAPRARAETTYQRRIRLYKQRHPGATTQEARGKPRREHVIRAKREREEVGQTTYERGVVSAIVRKQAKRIGLEADDAAELRRLTLLWAREKGFAEVQRLRERIKEFEKTKRHRVRVRRKVGGRVIRVEITGASSNVSDMQAAFAEFGLPALPNDKPEWHWFFYH